MNWINFNEEIRNSVMIFKFNWEFTNDNAIEIFDNTIKSILTNRIYNVIIDFWNIETINSRTAWWLAKIFEEIDKFWWVIYITNMNNFIEDTLDLLWMFFFLYRAEDNEKALSLIWN